MLYWQLTKLGVHCEVIAPSLVPVKAGDRVKTDRRDAEKLARAFRAGDLTSVFVPSAEHEALRDLVRAREAAKTDELRAKHRLSKYLLRYGKYPPAGARAWALPYWRCLKTVKLDHAAQNATLLEYMVEVEHQGARLARLEKAIDEAIAGAPKKMKAVIAALQSLRGVAKLTAVTLAVEVGSFQRLERATQLMSYTGMVPSERSSGTRERRGAITKAGNSRLRRVLFEAAHHYRQHDQPSFCPPRLLTRPVQTLKGKAHAQKNEDIAVRQDWTGRSISTKRGFSCKARSDPASMPHPRVPRAVRRKTMGLVSCHPLLGRASLLHHKLDIAIK